MSNAQNDPELIKLRIKRNMAARKRDKAEAVMRPLADEYWNRRSDWERAKEAYTKRLLSLGLCGRCEQQKTGSHPYYCAYCDSQYAGPAAAAPNIIFSYSPMEEVIH